MQPDTHDDFELIFDPLGKTAIIRRGTRLTWLDGPFRTYAEALAVARKDMNDRPQGGGRVK